MAVLVATAVGGRSGFIGGRLDIITQRFVDAWLAFPGLLMTMTPAHAPIRDEDGLVLAAATDP